MSGAVDLGELIYQCEEILTARADYERLAPLYYATRRPMMADKLLICTVKCRDCGEQLAQSHPVSEKEKLQLMLSAPLVTPSCPKGCRATYSDCNSNTDLIWTDAPMEDAGADRPR